MRSSRTGSRLGFGMAVYISKMGVGRNNFLSHAEDWRLFRLARISWPASPGPHLRPASQGLDEPSLFALAGETTAQAYRLLWLRTFHHPIAVRVDIKPDGTGVLTTKMSSGAGGYSPGKLVQNSSRKLDGVEVKQLLALIERVGFWAAPNPVTDQTGTDGSQWVIEGLKSGNYHVIDRWSPHQGPAHEIGMFLAFDLAKMDIPKSEIY
jgi:hypothetical protein